MARYGREMVEQLLADPDYRRDSEAAIPERYRVPNEAAAPLFVQADFGLDANLEPKLVEIQGFPSLYAYQPVMAECYREAYGIDPALAALPGGFDARRISTAFCADAIVGDHDPANVILLEIDPAHQKTRHDFLMTEQLFGVRAVDVRELRKAGQPPLVRARRRLTPVERIYNRAIVDELERRAIELPFDFRDDLDVEWAGHPNWFFRLSKFSLPYLDHPAVPRTQFLDRVGSRGTSRALRAEAALFLRRPGRGRWTHAEQNRRRPGRATKPISAAGARGFRRPVIDTPAGTTKIEVRIMYIWLDKLTAR